MLLQFSWDTVNKFFSSSFAANVFWLVFLVKTLLFIKSTFASSMNFFVLFQVDGMGIPQFQFKPLTDFDVSQPVFRYHWSGRPFTRNFRTNVQKETSGTILKLLPTSNTQKQTSFCKPSKFTMSVVGKLFGGGTNGFIRPEKSSGWVIQAHVGMPGVLWRTGGKSAIALLSALSWRRHLARRFWNHTWTKFVINENNSDRYISRNKQER